MGFTHPTRVGEPSNSKSAVPMKASFAYFFKAKLFLESEEQALIILKAVKPDMRNNFSRSHSNLTANKNVLEFDVKASDPTALRASFNSMMRSILVSGNILNAFGKEN